MRDWFARTAMRVADLMGSPWAFLIAATSVVAWAILGPVFGFSNTWQLVINTGTTIVTFLMVFLIQNTQNRESRATQLKLDELIRAVERANDQLIDIEEGSEQDLKELSERYRVLAERQSGSSN